MYENKVHGKAAAGEFLTGNLDFIALETDGAAANDLLAKLDKVVEVISLRGQPIILGQATASALKFANEHTEAWSAEALAQALLDHAGIVANAVVSSEIA